MSNVNYNFVAMNDIFQFSISIDVIFSFYFLALDCNDATLWAQNRVTVWHCKSVGCGF